jgi:methyltransferase (TIGR00027 family)
MNEAKPSRTAMRVAMRRAAHQLFDTPKVLDDPIAVLIIGAAARSQLEAALDDTDRASRPMRAFMAVRSRFAEDELARAIERGVTQYVILGAGLDTFAYRNPYPAIRIFEVDHPATQAWKRDKLAAASIPIPASLMLAPIDFERQSIAEGLDGAGFDRRAPTFFSWLGVTMYLTDEAIASTCAFVASTPRGGGLVFDYAVPRASLSTERGQRAFDEISRRVIAAGEPFRSFFDPHDLHERLTRVGFRSLIDLSGDDLNARYFGNRADGLRVSGSGLTRMLSAEI